MKRPFRSLWLGASLALLSMPWSTCLGNLTFGSNSFSGASNFNGKLGISPPTNIENYTTEANEPGHRSNGSAGAGKTAWWRWTAPEDGFVSMDTLVALDAQIANPVRNTVIAVYIGTTLSNLQRVTANEDYWLIRTGFYERLSNVAFYATKGVVYRIAVDGYAAGSVGSGATNVMLQLRQLSARQFTRQAIWGDSDIPGLRGSLSLTQTAANVFTAVLTMGGRTVRFRGVFDIEGYYRASFDRPTRRGTPPLPPLLIEIDGVANTLRTHDSMETRTHVEFPEVAAFSSTAPNPVAGYYTAGVGITGYATATVAASGRARGSVRVPDGSAFTFSNRLTYTISPSQFFLPILRFLRNGTGFWSVHTRIVDTGIHDQWSYHGTSNRFVRAPAPNAAYYTTGLSQFLTLVGGSYSRPSTGQRALGFLNSSNGAGALQLHATPGELTSPVTQSLSWSPLNRITFSLPALRPTLSFNARTGLATGGITLPGERRRTLRGILYQQQGATSFSGYATGRTRTVHISIASP